jgi:hypothetical protein
MGKIKGHDVLADNIDEYEEDGSRYDSVVSPERRPHGEVGGESGGVRSGANSPELGGRPPLGEENTGFEFGFLAVDTGAEPREEAREMVLENARPGGVARGGGRVARADRPADPQAGVSPAWAQSISLPYVSTCVQTTLRGSSARPTMETSSPARTTPWSISPVTTVPRLPSHPLQLDPARRFPQRSGRFFSAWTPGAG